MFSCASWESGTASLLDHTPATHLTRQKTCSHVHSKDGHTQLALRYDQPPASSATYLSCQRTRPHVREDGHTKLVLRQDQKVDVSQPPASSATVTNLSCQRTCPHVREDGHTKLVVRHDQKVDVSQPPASSATANARAQERLGDVYKSIYA